MIEIFGKRKWDLPFRLFIFWSWTYEKEIKNLAYKYKNIHFFWRQNLDTIKRYVSNCQYYLMPSVFLETFWLTALTALSRWLPTIWFAKWWVKDFILPELDLNQAKWNFTSQKLFNLINNLLSKKKLDFPLSPFPFSLSPFQLASRKNNITKLLPSNTKKILIVSDFINKIWWIETYIRDCKYILENMWYQVQIFGGKLPKWPIWKLAKYLGIFSAVFNFYEAIKLLSTIKKFNPDLIRFNSILRYLWRMSVWINQFSKAKKWMMYHDFGYFFPFPNKLYETNQIKYPLSLKNYVQSAQTKNPIKILFIIWKYFSVYLIKNKLKKIIDKHLVPSKYMEEIVHKSYKIPKEKIITLPHFIQE